MPLFSSIRSQSAFTLIEVLIAILIFSLGLIAAFILTSTATSLSMRSKQEIIATNLLREQLEIAKNIRDTNFLALRKYNSLEGAIAPCSSSGCSIMTPGYWVLGIRYDSVQAPIFAKAIVSPLLLSITPSSNPPTENAHR